MECSTDGARQTGARDPHVVRIVERAAAALLGSGLPAHRVEESLGRLSRACGARIAALALPTSVIITLKSGAEMDTFFARATKHRTDLAHLAHIHDLVVRTEANEIGPAEFSAELDRPAASPYSRGLVEAGVALVAIGAALLLGAFPVESVFAGMLAVVASVLATWGAEYDGGDRIAAMTCALGASVAAVAAAHAGIVEHPLLVTIAALVHYLPGLSMTIAATELGTGHLVSGSARAFGAATTVLVLALGILFGASLGSYGALATVPPSAPGLFLEVFAAFALASGFVLTLRVPRRDAALAMLVALGAHALRRASGSCVPAALSLAIASTGVGLVANAIARRRDSPAAIHFVPGVSMLLPGSLSVMGVSRALLRDVHGAAVVAGELTGLVSAIAAGIVASNVLLPVRAKPGEGRAPDAA